MTIDEYVITDENDDPYFKALLEQSNSLILGAQQSLDEYLQNFFKSKENAERYGHLYIMEQNPYQFETKLGEDNVMHITAHTTYRLRLKTPEELRQSR